jgi:hypothetical protein
MTNRDWAAVKTILGSKLSEEESRIIDLLISGKSTVEVGRLLGQHRSMIWRKVEKIQKRALGLKSS